MLGNVMIVDDSAIGRKIIRNVLESKLNDINIIEVEDGLDIISKIIQHQVHVCILDVMMPEKDGFEVLQEIKKNSVTTDIPVIMCSALGDIQGIERALKLGAYDYFTKPLTKEIIEISLPLKVKNSIDCMKRKQEISYLSYHDKLTGLYNRRFFQDQLKRVDLKSHLPISVIMGDINGLKLTNDVFGHQMGDRILQEIATIIRQCCRQHDIVARWGGDEFIVLLPQTPYEVATTICEYIGFACSHYENPDLQLSISLGQATKQDVSRSIMDTIKAAEQKMYRHKLLESRSFHNSMLNSLKIALLEKNYETAGHTERMAYLSRKIGGALKLTENQQDDLCLLAILHDIGKIGIPDSILTKPGSLSDEEWEEIKRHPEIGYRIARSSPETSHIAESILCHHERWDGKGYPQGLQGVAIPRLSRIIAIIDAYDAMLYTRPYKEGISHVQAIEEIVRCAGTQFDPDLVHIFRRVMDEYCVQSTMYVQQGNRLFI